MEPASIRRPRIFLSVVMILLGFGLFSIFIFILLQTTTKRPDNVDEARAKLRSDTLQKLRMEDEKALATYGWVDKEKGIARIPITVATQLIVDVLKNKPIQAGPFNNPLPDGSVTPQRNSTNSVENSPQRRNF